MKINRCFCRGKAVLFGLLLMVLSAPGEHVYSEPVSRITLPEEQKYQGDLILVSSDHAYDFEANESAALVLIRETQTCEYPLENSDCQVISKIMPSLDRMISDCNDAMGTKVTGILSGWRSETYQQEIWDSYELLYGVEYCRQYVASPGYSEHHTGLAVDLGIIYDDGSQGSFPESENAAWMAENSWRYGFVRRYAEDKTDITKISNEAWHFRYVGQPHAAFMYENNFCLEEYLEYLRGHSTPSGPVKMEAEGAQYAVYYTGDPVIDKPEGDYSVSGDNMNGYIVTYKTP